MDSLIREDKKDKGASTLFWGIMIVGLLAAGGLIAYFALSPTPPPQEERLENALREGEEFEFLKQRIVVAENRDFTSQTQSLAGGIEMRLVAVVRNFSNKKLTGLEIVGSVVDEKGSVVKEKTAVVIPKQVQFIENNKSAPIEIRIGGFSPNDDRANFKFRITGIKVE